MFWKIKYEYWLVIISLVWLLVFSFVVQLNFSFNLKNDEVTYLEASKLLYFEGKLDNTRPLIISVILGLPFIFGLDSLAVIKFGYILNVCCWILTSVFVFKIISQQLSTKKAFLYALIFILCLGNLAHVFKFLSESVFIFLIVLSIYFISQFFKNKNFSYLNLAISVLIINSLIKPVCIGLVLILGLFFVSKIKKIIFNKFSFLVILSSFLIFFQIISMKKYYGDYTLSYISSITYYTYLGAKADCIKKGIKYLPGENLRTKKFNLLTSNQMKSVANADLINQLKSNKINLAKAYLFCIYSNSSKGNYIISECKNQNNTFYFDFFRFLFKAISKLQNIIFTILAVLLSIFCIFKSRFYNSLNVIIACFILYLFFISAISCFECDRFHIAFFPLFFILFSDYYKNFLSFFNKVV